MIAKAVPLVRLALDLPADLVLRLKAYAHCKSKTDRGPRFASVEAACRALLEQALVTTVASVPAGTPPEVGSVYEVCGRSWLVLAVDDEWVEFRRQDHKRGCWGAKAVMLSRAGWDRWVVAQDYVPA